MRRAALAALVLVAVTGARAIELAARPKVRVQPGVLAERVLARAIVEAQDGVAEVRARADGRVKRVLVRVGDTVRAGDLLADIEEDELSTEVNRRAADRRAAELAAELATEGVRPEQRAVTAAEVDVARRELALAEARAARETRLADKGSTSQAAADEARRNLEIARARLGSAEAQLSLAQAGGRASEARAAQARAQAASAALRLAKSGLARTRLLAPIDGVVLERRIDPGDTITGTATGGPLEPLFEIADNARLQVRIEVEERDAMRLAVGQAVAVTLEGGGEVLAHAKLGRLSPRLSSRTLGLQGVRVRADGRVRAAWAPLDGEAAHRLVIGQPLEAEVLVAVHRVAAQLPRRAVQVRDGRAVVDEVWGPWLREREVQLRAVDADAVEIHELAPGRAVLLH
jgi:multidrug resistance efflux pump